MQIPSISRLQPTVPSQRLTAPVAAIYATESSTDGLTEQQLRSYQHSGDTVEFSSAVLKRPKKRRRFDGLLFEEYEHRVGPRAALLRESDKDLLGLLYARTEANGADPDDPDDPRMTKIDSLAVELIKQRAIGEATAKTVPPSEAELFLAGEETRPLSREFQMAMAAES